MQLQPFDKIPDVLVCQRITYFCPRCDTVEPEGRKKKKSEADSEHFRSPGADSVGDKCDRESPIRATDIG